MPNFYYKAKKENAETVLGQLTARNQEEAIDLINQMGLVAVSVDEKSFSSHSGESARGKVCAKEIYFFGRQLFSLLKAGLPILKALAVLQAQTRNPSFKKIVASISTGIKDGQPFSDCLNNYPGIFSLLYVNLIRVGEESGSLKEVLFSITEYQRNQQELLGKLRSALVYPAFMAVVGLGTVIFILSFVMPRIVALFSSNSAALPVPTLIVMHLSDWVQKGWYWMILGGIFIFFLGTQFKNSSRGRKLLSRFELYCPGLSSFTVKVELARLMRTMELLLKSGIPILRSIEISVPVLNNELIKAEILRSHKELTAGGSWGASLKKSALIPVMVSDLITVAEESGSLIDIFSEIASNYEEDTKEVLKVLTTLLEPLMILLVGSVVGFIVFAILLPIFQVDTLAR